MLMKRSKGRACAGERAVGPIRPQAASTDVASDSAPKGSLVRLDRSGVDGDGCEGHGGPRSGAAGVNVLAGILPTAGRQRERNDIPGVSVL
jgi:hypothetical protein